MCRNRPAEAAIPASLPRAQIAACKPAVESSQAAGLLHRATHRSDFSRSNRAPSALRWLSRPIPGPDAATLFNCRNPCPSHFTKGTPMNRVHAHSTKNAHRRRASVGTKTAILAAVVLCASFGAAELASAAGPYGNFRNGPTLRPGDAVSLNPQPLPPRPSPWRFNPGGKSSLNPQPLPPRVFMYRNFRR